MTDTPKARLFALRERLNAKALATMVDRNASYATPEEPIRNYVCSAILTKQTPANYIIGRTTEKLVRMQQAAERGSLGVVEEEAREIMNLVALAAFAVGEGLPRPIPAQSTHDFSAE